MIGEAYWKNQYYNIRDRVKQYKRRESRRIIIGWVVCKLEIVRTEIGKLIDLTNLEYFRKNLKFTCTEKIINPRLVIQSYKMQDMHTEIPTTLQSGSVCTEFGLSLNIPTNFDANLCISIGPETLGRPYQ